MGKGKGGHRRFVMPDDPMAPPVEEAPDLPENSSDDEEVQRKPKTVDELLDLEVENPNRVKKKEFVKLTDNVEPPKREELSRKERKEIEEREEKEREYQNLSKGLTPEAREELEKVRIIREKREIEEKRRKEELERIEQNKLAAQKRVEELLAKKQNANKKGKKKKK